MVVPADTARLQLGRRGQPHQISCPIAELPDLADIWAWAHAQITNLEPDDSLHDILEHQPARAISRLIRPNGSLVRRSHQYVPLDSHAFASGLVTGKIFIRSRLSIGEGMVPLDDLTESNFFLPSNKYGRSSNETFAIAALRNHQKIYHSGSLSQWLEKAPRTKRFRWLTSAVL